MNFANKLIHQRIIFAIFAIFLFIVIGATGCTEKTENTPATSVSQTTFTSPDDAVNALVVAMRSHDNNQLRRILGPESEDLLSSGDQITDQQTQERFLEAYDQKHQIVINADGSATVDVGNKDWPMPIPIVQDDKSQTWTFDTAAGKDEIINRRIGRNELDVIQVCKAICDAQTEYARRDPNNDGVPEYARDFISDPGTKNGLYWETNEGETPSPLGPFVAEAEEQGYSSSSHPDDQPRPYHGYFYRILTSQGSNAPGGEMDYVLNGKLIGGFAVVAWPADYGNSGIMTFIANYTGDVYQKDLGEDTDKVARSMSSYDPGPGWTKSE